MRSSTVSCPGNFLIDKNEKNLIFKHFGLLFLMIFLDFFLWPKFWNIRLKVGHPWWAASFLTWQPEAPEELSEGLHQNQVSKVMKLHKGPDSQLYSWNILFLNLALILMRTGHQFQEKNWLDREPELWGKKPQCGAGAEINVFASFRL